LPEFKPSYEFICSDRHHFKKVHRSAAEGYPAGTRVVLANEKYQIPAPCWVVQVIDKEEVLA
jgi:hypothetical protein